MQIAKKELNLLRRRMREAETVATEFMNERNNLVSALVAKGICPDDSTPCETPPSKEECANCWQDWASL